MDRICKYVVYVCWLMCLVFMDLFGTFVMFFRFPSLSLSLYIYIYIETNQDPAPLVNSLRFTLSASDLMEASLLLARKHGKEEKTSDGKSSMTSMGSGIVRLGDISHPLYACLYPRVAWSELINSSIGEVTLGKPEIEKHILQLRRQLI